MQMAIYETLILLLNAMRCLFLHGKLNLMNEMGRF